MSSRKRLYTRADERSDINVSPLIDIVFILLIFFIVTTVFIQETGVEVTRPQATSSTMLEKDAILIAITEEGSVVYGGREIGVSGVRSTVKRLLQGKDTPVIIQADKSTRIELYTRVHDEAQLGGAKLINMATQR